ncbi:hypothetical protein J3T65_09340 [Staphylococcus simiae]|uniref:hypothetical protein n=1 Tax=Staphylococcus simiae TaxID=308354 RepID=UPI001A96C4AF|nr:hypothetical protein [Staphylococcus simiae]MBO1199432.1 hypothetical protein [Staphylococcus simiae]MBO1201875.1 hypothetical protein [Staphylococcus simiae]MBO1204089.1 hypothetical protein [Staphylococcus simiae]MBO1211144.1 hypothetical protein [Staphylococcus simiae]MBO1230324.1 hypothetical protein [Staphylococcus simiae]
MQLNLKEAEILDYLKQQYPQKTFSKGRLLIGQHKRDDLEIFYFGEDFLVVIMVGFKTYEVRTTNELDYQKINRVALKDGVLYRKMTIETSEELLQYETSKLLESDFHNDNFEQFIKGQKERVIYEHGQFL